jgi:hypothetical protein
VNGGKDGKCERKKRKRSHLPCAGIILFRFYGYYLSLTLRFMREDSAPRELYRAGFPPAIQRYVTVHFNQRQIIKFICNILS